MYCISILNSNAFTVLVFKILEALPTTFNLFYSSLFSEWIIYIQNSLYIFVLLLFCLLVHRSMSYLFFFVVQKVNQIDVKSRILKRNWSKDQYELNVQSEILLCINLSICWYLQCFKLLSMCHSFLFFFVFLFLFRNLIHTIFQVPFVQVPKRFIFDELKYIWWKIKIAATQTHTHTLL